MNIDMIETLKRFTEESLFEASSDLLNKLNIGFEGETAEPIDVADIYDGPMPQYLTEALKLIKDTYFIGVANDLLLSGSMSSNSLDDISETIENGGKYDGMFVFACDTKDGEQLSRSQASALTRAFNRISYANPVILVIREGDKLSLATCERMNYTQEWRQGTGEKLGKVSILRNINCNTPHRGHVDILNSLAAKVCITFDDLYHHWMDIFSSELLTKKFYNELSDWYAWAVQVAKFPNSLTTSEDDAKYNHEACIRLITRLIFVWFLKQKGLIPEEFFDEKYIRDNFIENFDPHDKQSLYYDAGKSKYYRLILQNLFFAMLNCPIVAEGKVTPNNRRFRRDAQLGINKNDYNVNNLMRYKSEFAGAGAEKFVKLANSNVPFLNGGLFDCLDDKVRGLYYDGFSERKESLEQLFFPDYLFFGEEVGAGIDLSQWYDDKKKKNVSARGIIDILKRYSFTIEENTPYDQEVSLDPELLGKVFENLLAAYNPETKQSARKQTGSFYTPREIVQYMVDESLVAHLKRMCGNEMESEYRALLSYASDAPILSEKQRKDIMYALYNCQVLDPACGSGAFPMGILQQMVHVLKRVDPTNQMWNSMMVDIAKENAGRELLKVASSNQEERQKIQAECKARLDDIENAFNSSVNDPDYARKLYLIEHCIYGVDIQPIATQISKLRFFISLVVDQKRLGDPKSNFGIRPLPNLESKFVTANTLIPLKREKTLFTDVEDVRDYEEQLRELNHKIFLAKKNTVKLELRERMCSVRRMMAETLYNRNIVDLDGSSQLIGWDMFNQNSSASFFDTEWMFGIRDGFDIIIANPPYVNLANIKPDEYRENLKKLYKTATNKSDLYAFFIEFAFKVLKPTGFLSYIVPHTWKATDSFKALRELIFKEHSLCQVVNLNMGIFDATVKPMIILLDAQHRENYSFDVRNDEFAKVDNISINEILTDVHMSVDTDSTREMKKVYATIEKAGGTPLSEHIQFSRGVKTSNDTRFVLQSQVNSDCKKVYRGRNLKRYRLDWENEYLWYRPDLMREKTGCVPHTKEFFEVPEKIVTQRVNSSYQLMVAYDCEKQYFLDTVNVSNYSTWNKTTSLLYLCGLLNSKLINFWYCNKFRMPTIGGYELHSIPIKVLSNQNIIIDKVNEIINITKTQEGDSDRIKELMGEIDYVVYHLYGLSYDEVLVIDPDFSVTRNEYEKYSQEHE